MDAHAHLHASVPLAAALESAAANLRAGAREIGLASPGAGVLFLAETRGDHPFDELAARAERRDRAAGWALRSSGERCSLVAEKGDDVALVLVAGRQTITREGLELLLLGTRRSVRSGAPLETMLEKAGPEVLAVLPWGLGKWWFRRGRKARRALLTRRWPTFAGDTVHRPASGPEPPLLRRARRHGVPILPGSDPLPLSGGHSALGSYGFVYEGALSPSCPAAAVVTRLRDLRRQPRVFGRPGGTWKFVRGQALMQLRKRLGTGRR